MYWKVWLMKEQSQVEWMEMESKERNLGFLSSQFPPTELIIKYKLHKMRSNTAWPNSRELSQWRPCKWCFLKPAPHPSVSTCLESNPGALPGQLVVGWGSPTSQQALGFSSLSKSCLWVSHVLWWGYLNFRIEEAPQFTSQVSDHQPLYFCFTFLNLWFFWQTRN